MSMEKEWNELKAWLENKPDSYFGIKTDIQTKMAELERRSLPESVAKILRAAKWECGCWPATLMECLDEIARALEKGDTTRIEKWTK